MQPIAHPFNVNTLRSSRPRWSCLKPKTESSVGAKGIIEASFARLLLMVLLVQFFCGCVSLVYYEGDYHGKVIDAETLQPIKGAVVLGVWSKGYPGAGGIAHEYYDARETLTNENGDFTIKGMGPRAMTHLEKMDIVIFKVGYEEVGLTSWDSLKTAIYYRDRVKWEGNKAIIPLDKLSLEQRRKRFDASPTGVPLNKHIKLLEEIERENEAIR